MYSNKRNSEFSKNCARMILLLITLGTFAYAEEYQVEILDIGQDRGYQKCTHFVYFALALNDIRISDRTNLEEFSFRVISVKTDDAVAPEEAAFEESLDKETADIIEDPQNPGNYIGKATFEKHERKKYYHFRVIARTGDIPIPIATSKGQVAYIRSGFPELGFIVGRAWWEKAVEYVIYFVLGLTLVVGAIAFVKTRNRLAVIVNEEDDICEKHLENGIIKKWNDLAHHERQLKLKKNKNEWDNSANMIYEEINELINDIPKREKKEEVYPIVKIMKSGLINHYTNQGKIECSREIDRAMTNEAEFEYIKHKGKSLERIRQMAVIAPSLGLLGTVFGISMAFSHLPAALNKGKGIAEALAPQINLALWTTIGGLVIALILTMGHQFVSNMLTTIESRWQNIMVRISREI